MLLLWFACTAAPLGLHSEDPGPGPDSEGSGPPDSPAEDEVEQVPGVPFRSEPCADLYDPDQVQHFEVEISDEEWAGLLRDYSRGEKNYHPITFILGDERREDASIRLKGNPSFSWFTEKMQFVIAFNEQDREGRFHGLRKLSLDAAWYEPTMLRDRVAWSLIRRQGELPSACANSAWLDINGEPYGLYTNIEYLDHEWLERSFGDEDATGTLWKYGDDPVSNADAATGSLELMSRTTDPGKLVAIADLEEWLLAWAAEIVVGDDDGYWCCDHNYYLYEHPDRGLLFVPWDLDDNFDVQGYDVDPITGYPQGLGLFQQPHFHALVSDPTWGPVFLDQLDAMNEAFDPALVQDEIAQWQDQIDELIEEDPTRSFGWEEHLGAVQRFSDWVPARHEYLRSWTACARGESTDADGDGFPVCNDPNDSDPSVHTGATEICDGFDNDADGWVDDDPSCQDCARHDLEGSHFLFCRWPRTNTQAKAACSAQGGTLAGPLVGYEQLYAWFYAWPVQEDWWTGGKSGTECKSWDEARGQEGSAPCEEAHPSICRLP